jgi:hypothetical protein
MRVILFNRKEIIISKEQYEKLWLELEDEDGSKWVKINGLPYRKTAIAHFEQGGYTEADVVKTIPEEKRISQPTVSQETIDRVREKLFKKGILKKKNLNK